jgi:ribosome-binding factor A
MKLASRFAGAIIIMVVALTAGCNFGPGPKEVLSKYLESYLHGSYDKAYELLSSKDKAVKSQQEFSGDIKEIGGLMKGLSSKVSYNVKDVKVTGDKALANVDVTMPDMSGAMGELLGVAMQSAFGGGKPDDKAMEKLIAEKLKDKNLPTTTRTEQYDLVKDKDGWRVYMGWENQKKIQALKAEAEKLEKQKKFAEAKAKYVEVQGLSSRDETAPKKIKELEEKAARYKEIQAYFQNIEVRNIHTGRGVLGDMGVFGEVKNKGDKTLKRVEITTYCLDKDGKVVFEKNYTPVLISEYNFMGDNQPLKPNYTRQFGCKLSDAPSDWSGKVRVAVTDVEFE